jgi:hypothetical protein
MSAAEALNAAHAAGVSVRIDGNDLLLEAPVEPPREVIDLLSRNKAGIVKLLCPAGDDWSAEDWRAFFDERAGIAEFDGGQSREQAEVTAFESCVVEWLNRNPSKSDPNRCAWCGNSDKEGHAIVPFGTESPGHTWLHPECWHGWHQQRRAKAAAAIGDLGISAPASHPIEIKRSAS